VRFTPPRRFARGSVRPRPAPPHQGWTPAAGHRARLRCLGPKTVGGPPAVRFRRRGLGGSPSTCTKARNGPAPCRPGGGRNRGVFGSRIAAGGVAARGGLLLEGPGPTRSTPEDDAASRRLAPCCGTWRACVHEADRVPRGAHLGEYVNVAGVRDLGRRLRPLKERVLGTCQRRGPFQGVTVYPA